MASLVISRLLSSVVALIGATFFVFITLRIAPGDPARLVLGRFAPDDAVAALSVEMGLDKPFLTQYWTYVSDFFRGDWGWSYSVGQPVKTVLAERFPATLELGLYAFVFAFGAALLLALLATYRRGPLSDGIPRLLAVLSLGIPQFWFALVALIVGFEMLGLFPGPVGRLPSGMAPPPDVTGLYTVDALLAGEVGTFFTALHFLILPSIALGILPFGYLLRLLRANLLDAMDSPYVLVARGHGLSKLTIFLKYILPNAIVPTLTASAMILGQMLAGSVLVERVFNWPGAGSLVTEGVLQQDFSVVQTFILLSTVIFITANLLVDILIDFIDPRFSKGDT